MIAHEKYRASELNTSPFQNLIYEASSFPQIRQVILKLLNCRLAIRDFGENDGWLRTLDSVNDQGLLVPQPIHYTSTTQDYGVVLSRGVV